MLAKSLRGILLVLAATGLLVWSSYSPAHKAQASASGPYQWVNTPTDVIAPVFTQPVDSTGKLLISSWLDPDGSNLDKYVWDNFTLLTTETLTGIQWVGGYDPTRFGAGGPVLDFRVDIYPSIPAGTEPAIANPPLVRYMTGGNAGQAPIGTVGGIPMYSYTFNLPANFIASAGVKYWVQIEAYQGGSMPDWGIAKGTGGNSSHFVRESGAGGDIIYHTVPDDAAFTMLGLVPDVPTDILLSPDTVDENQPTNTIVGELTAADPNPSATFTFSLACTYPGVDDASFNVSSPNLRTSNTFDYEAKNRYDICVRVTNQDGQYLDKNLIVYITNINEAPTDITLSNNSVFEHLPANTVVGALTGIDPDAGGSHTFSLECVVPGADDGSFNINGASLRTSAVFDFGTKSSYTICIHVADQSALAFEKNFVITVLNAEVIYAPIIIKP
jgi:hypothetical protein